jgi:type 1 glutamine amidotransferase
MKPSLAFLSVITLAMCPLVSVTAAAPKRVLVVTLTTGFRHTSIPLAEALLVKLGETSGAYTVVDFARQPTTRVFPKPNKPGDLPATADEPAKARHAADLKNYDEALAKWSPDAQTRLDAEWRDALAKISPARLLSNKIDMVVFANTTGELAIPEKEGFIQWIQDGHAFVAMHSGCDTYHQFPAYLDMLQGQFAGHQAQVPAELFAGDTKHPANGGIGATWKIEQEEMYIIKRQNPGQVHSLWFMRHHPNDVNDVKLYPVSWCRMAGKGRVFYTSLGHREDLWSDDPALPDRRNTVETSKRFQQHLLGGLKWSLGLVPGSAEPNPDVK